MPCSCAAQNPENIHNQRGGAFNLSFCDLTANNAYYKSYILQVYRPMKDKRDMSHAKVSTRTQKSSRSSPHACVHPVNVEFYDAAAYKDLSILFVRNAL